MEGRTCTWPIYVDKETHKIIDTVTNMMHPIDPLIVEGCKKITKNTKSDALKTFMTEMFLTYNTDIIRNNIDFIVLACDTNTKEIIDFVNPQDDKNKINHLIDLIDNACRGVGKNGNANDLMTIIGNVVARYCATNIENEKSFSNLINFWKDKMQAKQFQTED